MRTKTDLALLILPPVAAVALALSVSAGLDGLPLDDAYIFRQYAQNLASGHGYSFNPGETSFGVTSFVWTLLNAALLKIVPGAGFNFLSRLAGIALFASLIVTIEIWLLKETSSVALASSGGFLATISPITYMNAASGMETMLFAAALIGFFYAYRFYGLKRPLLMGLAAGVVYLVRPEGLYAAFAVVVIEAYFAIRLKEGRRLSRAGLFAAGCALVALPVEFYILSHGAGALPSTYYGKLGTASECGKSGIMEQLISMTRYTFKGHGRTVADYGWAGGIAWAGAAYLLCRSLTGVIKVIAGEFGSRKVMAPVLIMTVAATTLGELWRHGGLELPKAAMVILIAVSIPAILTIYLLHSPSTPSETDDTKAAGYIALLGLGALPAVYGLLFRAGPLFGGYYNRYICVLTPVLWLGAIVAGWKILHSRKKIISTLVVIMLAYSALLAGLNWNQNSRVYENEVRLNEGLRTRAALWIKNHTPPDSVVLVGYTGLGVVGNKCDRYVLDLGALINPDILRYYKGTPCPSAGRWPLTVAYMRARDVSYFVTVHGPADNPHANPGGVPGFERVARFEDKSLKGVHFNAITVWKVNALKAWESLQKT